MTSKCTLPHPVSNGIVRAAATTARTFSAVERSRRSRQTSSAFFAHSSSADGPAGASPVPADGTAARSRARIAATSASTRILSAWVKRIWPVAMSTSRQFTSTTVSRGV